MKDKPVEMPELRELPSYEETVILVNQNRLALQGMSLAIHELNGLVVDLANQMERLINVLYPEEQAEEVVEAQLVDPVE